MTRREEQDIKRSPMTVAEALRTLDRETRFKVKAEIYAKYEDPVKGEIEYRQRKAEAIEIACECMRQVISMDDDGR